MPPAVNTDLGGGGSSSGGGVSVRGPGQRFTIQARYATSDPTGADVQRAAIMLRQPDTNQWVYLYLDLLASSGTPQFTAWGYSPYPNTARDADATHTRSQRLTADGALRLGAPAITPAGDDARVLLTRGRQAFTVDGVRVFREVGQTIVEWQLTWGISPTGADFPAGALDVHAWIRTTAGVDGWDRVGSLRLQR